ncbi:MAG TPA: hypothetical protein VK553_02935 [Candidatus Nitrosopolaris rasttigaisensis]|nr:hypothetical protein [Candidatus Nitrosopolaris rasttigaisensis]
MKYSFFFDSKDVIVAGQHIGIRIVYFSVGNIISQYFHIVPSPLGLK